MSLIQFITILNSAQGSSNGGGGGSSDWILATGFWNNAGVWDNDSVWP